MFSHICSSGFCRDLKISKKNKELSQRFPNSVHKHYDSEFFTHLFNYGPNKLDLLCQAPGSLL